MTEDAAKAAQQAEILKQTIVEDEKPEASLTELLKQEKKKKNKRNIIFGGGSLFVIVIGLLIFNSSQPRLAGTRYAICHTLLELLIPYPHTLHVSTMSPQRDGSLRLWYNHIDAFGEFRMEPFTCTVYQDKQTNKWVIKEVKLNTVSLEPTQIAFLNNAMVYFDENPIKLEYPTPLPNKINNLRFRTDSFWNVKLRITREYGY